MRLALVLAAVVLGGCAEQVAPAGEATGILRVVDVGADAYEPSIGITGDGTLLVNAYGSFAERTVPGVWRSTDGGATWAETMEDTARAPGSGDPWLWVDPAGDRVFTAELITGGCSWLSWSDDAGGSWERTASGGCGLPAHHFQKLTGGAAPAGVTTDGYPSVLYYSSTSLRDPDPARPTDLIVGGTGSDIAVSLDGGATFSLPVRVHPPTPGGYSQAGPVAVGPDGTAWSPAQTDAGVRIARTGDAGATWELVATLEDVGYQPYGSDPSLAVDARGVLYLLYPSRESQPVLRWSEDGGETWSSPRSIAPLGVTSAIFPLLRSADDGALVAAYVATTDDSTAWDADPSFAPPVTAWRLHLARIVMAAGEPSITTVVAEADPVQRGCIWMRGGADPGCRNLGDFIGLATRAGLVAAAFADGCDACPEGEQSTANAARVALWRPDPEVV